MMKTYLFLLFVFTVSNQVIASDLTLPNSFTEGTTASADEVNANFNAVKSAVDDNYARIISNEAALNNISVERQFVGFSNDAVAGDSGLVGINAACAATYGTGARICFDSEVYNTPNLQPIPSVSRGWLQPTNFSFDSPAMFSCKWWSFHRIDQSATWLTGEMGIDWGDNQCAFVLPVACCK